MPQIYRRPTEFSGSLQPTDADDSIVLSDLVRTGEASRLRRRGAMRIDHAGPHRPAVSMSVPPRDRLQQPPYVALASPTWSPDPDGIESDGEDGGGGAVLTRRDMFTEGRYGTVEYGDHGEGASGDSGVFTLYCGGQVGWEFEEEQSNWSSSSSSHYDPSPLPSYPPKSSSSSLHRTPSQLKKTNGCGAVVHVHASPRRRCFVWAANTPASASVVPLDTSYFDVGVRSMMMNSSCGCVKEGIGCAVW
ncbi:hypothetical protein JAAARDRAFT_213832 [Jaapia argillacea MUCL 33604]|uniref:Uncharacterized protein n=1 Tax=Jaapia argillacea MUCL 33604 TaxID=933084 RepID=A0A067QKE0_9AGAM|nr:hypothetical protein JAAARDRAFT_213832 [Jaapia argillacea MUCL 33604]